MSAPLEGILVVSLEQALAAPLATRHLADLGARVVKVERPGGGDFARHYDTTVMGQSSHFVWANRGKESVEVDVKSDFGRAVLERLVARADVVVSNLAPGAMERLELGAEHLRTKRPELIVCTISGYGSSGPYAQRRAYDLLVQCEAGLLAVTGTPAEPAKVGVAVADIAAAMYAYSGILSALFARQRTGDGATLDISMLEALVEWMGFPLYYTGYGGKSPCRAGARHSSIAPYGPFRLQDGAQVFLGVQNEREWRRLCEQVLCLPELVSDPRFASNPARVANSLELEAILEAALGGQSVERVMDSLEAAGIASARLRTVEDVLTHEQLAARGRWTEVGSPAGPIWALVPPGLDPQWGVRMEEIPQFGQHTSAILAELGLGPEACHSAAE
jgi:crotonobetainyl-CoA:carnitine CoA-transferase CaiB-like acyl-CoA transferase